MKTKKLQCVWKWNRHQKYILKMLIIYMINVHDGQKNVAHFKKMSHISKNLYIRTEKIVWCFKICSCHFLEIFCIYTKHVLSVWKSKNSYHAHFFVKKRKNISDHKSPIWQ